MKKIITLLLLTLSLSTFSQQLTYGSGGTIYNSQNQKLTPNMMRQLLATNTEALSLYNSGRNKKTWGNLLFYSGLGLVTVNLITAMNSNNINSSTNNYSNNSGQVIVSSVSVSSKPANMTAAIIGGAMILASIPIKIGYPKKIKSAMGLHNKSLADNYKSSPKTTLLASTNQIGFRIEF